MLGRSPSGRSPPMARRAGFWIAWYVPLVVLWLAFVDTLAWEEVAAGLVAAAVAATAAEIVRSPDLVRFPLDPRWLRGLAGLPWQVLRDTWLLTAALWRHCSGPPVPGSFRAVPFPSAADTGRPAGAGHRRGLGRPQHRGRRDRGRQGRDAGPPARPRARLAGPPEHAGGSAPMSAGAVRGTPEGWPDG